MGSLENLSVSEILSLLKALRTFLPECCNVITNYIPADRPLEALSPRSAHAAAALGFWRSSHEASN